MQHVFPALKNQMFFSKNRKIHQVFEVVVAAAGDQGVVTGKTNFSKEKVQHVIGHFAINDKADGVSGFSLFETVGNNFEKTL